MSALKEFLQTDAARILADAEAQRERYEQWNESIDQLFQLVIGWVKEADPEGLIHISTTFAEAKPPSNRPRWRLVMALGTHAAAVESGSPYDRGTLTVDGTDPPATFKAAGRAELVGEDDTYPLYLERADGVERWYLRTGPNRVRPLDRRSFERLLTGLLK